MVVDFTESLPALPHIVVVELDTSLYIKRVVNALVLIFILVVHLLVFSHLRYSAMVVLTLRVEGIRH
jgi:hypothetical protein